MSGILEISQIGKFAWELRECLGINRNLCEFAGNFGEFKETVSYEQTTE